MRTEQQEREAMLIETLQRIMAVVCGNRSPRWDTDEHVYASREAISNACEAALSAQPVAQQAPELDPLTLCECGDQFTKECPGTCVNCLAAMPKVRDEQDAKDAALWLSHEHMKLYLPHYTSGHNVFDAMLAAIKAGGVK